MKVAVEEKADAPKPVTKKICEVSDSLGRKLKVRKLNALHKVDLAQLVGAEGCANPGVIGPCAVAFSVTEIDGESIMPPHSYAELRHLIGKLDEEGLEAVAQAHADHFGIVEVSDLGAEDLKNS